MNPVTRGVRNAFRNGIRTASIVLILGLSIGLSIVMLIANKAIDNKIKSVKSNIGNTISISAAGTMGFQGDGNPLSQTSVDKLSSLQHVIGITETISDQLRNTDGTSRDGTTKTANTSLQSAIEAGSLGRRFDGQSGQNTTDSNTALPERPRGGGPGISAYGSTDTGKVNGEAITLSSGSAINGNTDKDVALIGKTLADKNGLKVGSTFTVYGETITVAGIYSAGTTFNDNSILMSLPALQRLSSQTGDLTSATVYVDSVSNIDGVTTNVKNTLGSTADVVSSKESVQSAIEPLNSVKTTATFSLIGATVAGAIIILLTMIMIVRERKREIGVVKAIGGSNVKIVSEFMVESLTLAVLGAVIGLIIGIVGGQPITKQLVTNSTTASITSQNTGSGFSGSSAFGRQSSGGFTRGEGFGRRLGTSQTVRGIDNVKTQIGFGVLAYGFGAALLIAVIGSGLAAAMIAKIRPSTVMRTE